MMNKVALLTSALVLAAVAPTPAAGACATAASADGPQLPSTAAVVRLATDWVDRINRADDAAYLRFVEERGPVLLGGSEQWLQLREFLRGMEYCGVKSATADAVELWVFDPNFDSYGSWRFKPAATAADRIEFMGGSHEDAGPPGAERPAALPLPALVKAVEARAAGRAAKDQFSGAILLAHGGRVLFEKAYGLADRASRKPNRLDTQFRFGSMGKMFTAVAIMQLAEKGKIDLDAPIGRYLTDYPNQDIATKVTVAHLLSHTGGTGDIFGPDFDRNKASLRSTKDYVALYGDRAAEFAPGSRQMYSNYGFILLGRIVEQVSGLGYDEYIQRNIFTPIGMGSTGNRPESDVLPRRAVSYMGSGARLKSAADTLPLGGTAAGGGYATVGDFHRFVGGLTSHRLLRGETLQKLIDGGVMADGQFASFDFGGTLPGAGRFIGHGGGAPGMSGSLHHFLNSGVTVIVLANRDPGTAESIAMFAAHRLPAGRPDASQDAAPAAR
ncbi:serine hydrolase [Sphingosinicella sp. BN140058]|uniref:serine hydrolase domain-containing protein n=1 Tax=Sphingosinicella sp. BN140058 TaxID=1892855 RepID=UPI0013ED0845|nr:serine hydrolase domain-containing protein [Sphingosinicella sp. BN140058]